MFWRGESLKEYSKRGVLAKRVWLVYISERLFPVSASVSDRESKDGMLMSCLCSTVGFAVYIYIRSSVLPRWFKRPLVLLSTSEGVTVSHSAFQPCKASQKHSAVIPRMSTGSRC
jgi:hypothetical protein